MTRGAERHVHDTTSREIAGLHRKIAEVREQKNALRLALARAEQQSRDLSRELDRLRRENAELRSFGGRGNVDSRK